MGGAFRPPSREYSGGGQWRPLGLFLDTCEAKLYRTRRATHGRRTARGIKMAKRNARVNSAFVLPVAITAASLFAVSVAGTATAAGLRVVTPGEQNTQSGENGCAAAPCANGHWFHYPEILAASLGAAYSV